MKLVVASRLGARLGRRARAMGIAAAQRRARDSAGESFGHLPSTSLLGTLPIVGNQVAAGEDPLSGTRKIDEN